MSNGKTAMVRLANYIKADNAVGAQRVINEASQEGEREILKAIVLMVSENTQMSPEMNRWANGVLGKSQ